MKKLFACYLLVTLLAASAAFAQMNPAPSAPRVTYKAETYHFTSGVIRVSDPNDQLYINYVGNTWIVPDNIELKNLVLTMWPGKLHGCTVQPQIQVSVDGGGYHISYELPNDQSQISFPDLLTAVTEMQTVTVVFVGGQNCTISDGGPLFIYPGWQERVAAGRRNSYFLTDTFITTAPGAGTTNFLKQTFDNPLANDPIYVQTAVDVLDGQVSSLRPFENCAPEAQMTWGGGSFSVINKFENSAGGQELVPQVLQTTMPGSPLTHTVNLGTGCVSELVGFNTTMGYGTDEADKGPFYLPGYYDTRNINSGPYVVGGYVRGNTRLILKTFRITTVGKMYPKHCKTFPSVELKDGTSTTKSLTLANGTDPFWSGSITIPPSSTDLIQYKVNPGVGCDSGEVQFNILSSYTNK